MMPNADGRCELPRTPSKRTSQNSPSRDCMKTPDRCRSGTPPSAENGLRGLYFGVWCYRRPTIGASPATFHTVALGTSVNKTFVRDAPGVLRWHHGGRRKGFGPVGQGLKGGGRDRMPTYVVLINFTDQGIRNVKQTIERTDSGGEIAEKHGLKLEQAYWTVGAYDMVAVFEAPNDEAISAHLLEIGSLGNVRTTTLRAYDEEEMSGLLRRLG